MLNDHRVWPGAFGVVRYYMSEAEYLPDPVLHLEKNLATTVCDGNEFDKHAEEPSREATP